MQPAVHKALLFSEEEKLDVFEAVRVGNWPHVEGMVDKNHHLLEARNEDGAALVHVAYLHKQYELGETLISKYPWCATLVYSGGAYEGENVLHIVIVQQALEQFDWLLSKFPELMDAETSGSFFEPPGPSYFGGYPILFAVSTDQPMMLRRMLSTPPGLHNTVLCKDRFGNSALHMAVIHSSLGMADLLLKCEHEGPLSKSLTDTVNGEGLTPLALAAAMGNVEMFQHLLKKSYAPGWVYGPIKSVMVPLRGIDQPYLISNGSAYYLSPQPLVMRCMSAGKTHPVTRCVPKHSGSIPEEVYSGRLRIATLPDIVHILDQKWHHFGKSLFLRRFIPAVIVMTLWTVATIIPESYVQDTDNLDYYPVNNGFIIACEACVLAYVVWMVCIELLRLFTSPRQYLHSHHGVVGVLFWLRVIFCLFVLIDVGLRAGQQWGVQAIFTSIASLVGWMYVLVQLVAFYSTGPYITMIYKIVSEDLRKFAIVFTIVLFGFTTALALVFPWEEPAPENQVKFFMMFRDLIVVGTIKRLLFEELDGNKYAWIFNILLILYCIFQTVTMMSILIANMEHTFKAVVADARGLWYIERNNLMAFFETEYKIKTMYQKRKKYSSQLAGDNRDFDADLYVEVVQSSEKWKVNVALKQQDWVEDQARKSIIKAEESARSQILQLERLEHQDPDRNTSHIPLPLRYIYKSYATGSASPSFASAPASFSSAPAQLAAVRSPSVLNAGGNPKEVPAM